MIDERIAFLRRTPFFGGLDEAALARVTSLLRESPFAAGALVFREAETGRSMYVVESGELLAFQNGDGGRTVKLMRLHAGDFFGEMTLIEMQPRPYSVVVEREARLLEFTNMDLYKLYREDVKSYVLVLQNINRELCRRLRRAGDRIAEIAGDDDVTQIGLPRPTEP